MTGTLPHAPPVLRPTFTIALAEARDEAMEKLKQQCVCGGELQCFRMFGEYGELNVPIEQQRLWSPHLSFYVANQPSRDDSVQPAACNVHGRFAPRMEVWTFVWIVYLAMAFSTFFGLTLAYSQWMLGEPIWGLAVALACSVVIVALYAIAYVGQRWSADQMSTLRQCLEDILVNAGLHAQYGSPVVSPRRDA